MRLEALLAMALAVGSALPSPAADPEAAERQYRIARRLAAEGSPEAIPAMLRVVELDPKGPLADDALVELAVLEGSPAWPEELGRVDAPRAERYRARLQEVLERFPHADRAIEARYRLALGRLEPLEPRDASRARVELLAVATAADGGPWSAASRHVLGWLEEQAGRTDRARAAYMRVVVDHSQDPAAVRARLGLARLDLRAGAFGAAAGWLQDVVEAGPARGELPQMLRESAVRGLLRTTPGGPGGWGAGNPRARSLPLRGMTAAVRAGGDLIVADRRTASVLRLDADGRTAERWTLDEVQALAVDPYGRLVAAAGSRFYRLEPHGPVPIGEQGGYAPVAAMAVDLEGALWAVDRRGERIGRMGPGERTPAPVWESRGARIASIGWDGLRLLAADSRTGRLLEILPDGGERPVWEGLNRRPVGLAVDSSGQLALLDGRGGEALLLGPEGSERDRFAAAAAGMDRPALIAIGVDGSLDLLDTASGLWVRVP